MTKQEQETVIQKMTAIIKEIPTSKDLVKSGNHEHQRYHYLARYLIQKAIKEEALLLSKDGNGIAILTRTSKKAPSFWKGLWDELKLVYHVTGFRKAWSLLKVQRYNKSQLPDEGEYLYCSFWGVVKEARDGKAALDLKNQLFDRASEAQLSIYAETRMRRKLIVYQRYGFEVFHTWERPDGDTSYYLRYTPPQEK